MGFEAILMQILTIQRDSKHSNGNSNHSKGIRNQIRNNRKGFEDFESNFEPFERDSNHSNANSNHSKGIRSIRKQILTIWKGFVAFELKFELFNRVIPCQISTKKSLPPPIWTKIGSYTVLVQTLIHCEFQRSMLYGFRVRARRKNWFLGKF